ncbi:hypothetical protein [Nocardia colli]|uniref:hypothetical protein n=1 Tax=Nocardia colli TaxID=2545717 RepID=UPI00168D8D64|nr:hypothetical protein [Nocardia colli]
MHRLIELSALPVSVITTERPELARTSTAGAPRVRIEKAARRLGWSPRFGLDDTLLALWRSANADRIRLGNN